MTKCNTLFVDKLIKGKQGLSVAADSNMAYRRFEPGPASSRVKFNREYLISPAIGRELNTYVTFDPFPTFNDLFSERYDDDGKTITDDKTNGAGTPGVRSLFNRAGAVIIGANVSWESEDNNDIVTKEASEFRISNNVPLMDNPATRRAIVETSQCTVKDLVRDSQQGFLGKATYAYSDFMYCKYLGRMSNNYLITLRRFPYPVDDYISTMGVTSSTRTKSGITSKNADCVGCMVTWLGTPGNDMTNILKYSVAMPFKEQKSKWEQGGVDADQGGGPMNALAAAFDPQYRKQYMAGHAGTQIDTLFNTFAPKWAGPFTGGKVPYPASQYNTFQDQTKVYGPIDAIKTTYLRDDGGLDFQQNISLTFDYELRSYNGINPRQAMLDLISNILHVTYNTGTFWGGGYRGGGAHQNNIFTNLAIYTKGDQGRGFAGYVDSFSESFSQLKGAAKSQIETNGGFLQTLKKLANTLGGMLINGLLNKLGRPMKSMANSLLSPAPVGFWHVTVGNPHHPIMSMGNMILKNTTIQHYGPLGIDDFPTGLKVTCELCRGKSRDIRDIEKLYMHGNDRIYTSMDKKVFDMYAHSKEYRMAKGGRVDGVAAYECTGVDGEGNDWKGFPTTGANATEPIDHSMLNEAMMKYFGHTNHRSILIPAMEQEHGAGVKKPQETAGKPAKPKKPQYVTKPKWVAGQSRDVKLQLKNGYVGYSDREKFDKWVANKLTKNELALMKSNPNSLDFGMNTDKFRAWQYINMEESEKNAMWVKAFNSGYWIDAKGQSVDLTALDKMSIDAAWYDMWE